MRFSRKYVIAAFVAVAASAVGVAVPAFAAETAAGKYVALGDSYASGLGAGDYGDSGSCKRSANAYAQQWANTHAPSAFEFAACSGAVTADVLSSQVGAITPDTELITISIGGNDAGFADVMTDCNLGSDSSCVSRNQEAQAFAQSELPGRLDGVYAEIRNRAPNARVIVVGYPRIYTLDGDCSAGLSETKRTAINQSSDVLGDVVSARSAAAGFEFLDGRSAFSGHEICAPGDDWWLNSITFPIEESYHPNGAGQNGYFGALVGITG
ncbi:MAG: SGNH/GDSL hydrolase family protein [Actinophytocola sp.]|uniref:SGNH/GDSL hydrolase family protein n=1 Tax=Actinophytocola sp. TaxID=1872138 RepID=UPI003D6C6993